MKQVLDMQVIEELLSFSDDGDPELLLDLIQMFLEDGPTKVQSITEGLTAGDFDKMERAAHSLKGSSGNLGAKALQDACEQMQLASRNHQLEQARLITSEIAAAFSTADEALRQLQASYKS